MSLHINSKQTRIKVGEHKGEDMYVMKVNHYSTIDAEKIIQYASETCQIPKGVIRASWEAIGGIITCYDTKGNKMDCS